MIAPLQLVWIHTHSYVTSCSPVVEYRGHNHVAHRFTVALLGWQWRRLLRRLYGLTESEVLSLDTLQTPLPSADFEKHFYFRTREGHVPCCEKLKALGHGANHVHCGLGIVAMDFDEFVTLPMLPGTLKPQHALVLAVS